jgi:mono/diheme cytochrome c family protein
VRGPLPSRQLNLRAAAGIAAVGALLVAGCNKDSGDLNRGQQLFTSRCASCHTLAAANANGAQGPSLDDAFAAARARGMDGDTIAGVVKAQVENPRPAATVNPNPSVTMPPDLASGQDLDDIAAYVGAVAGTGQKPPQLSSPQLFVANCGSCHTLAEAGTSGTTGPDLDKSLAGTTKDFIHTSIVDPNQQIAKGYPPNVMPQNFETTIQSKDLNALVSFLYSAANGGGSKASGGK